MLIYLNFLLKYIKINLYIFKMYSCDGNVEFLQSSVSHDPSEIILILRFVAQETFLIIINVKNSCSA